VLGAWFAVDGGRHVRALQEFAWLRQLALAWLLFALVITAAGINLYIPWLLQIYATMWPKPPGLIGVQAGAFGGMLTLFVMLWDLGRDSAADRYQR